MTRMEETQTSLPMSPKVLVCMSLGVIFSVLLGALYGLGFGDVMHGVAFFGGPFAAFLCWGISVYFSASDETGG